MKPENREVTEDELIKWRWLVEIIDEEHEGEADEKLSPSALFESLRQKISQEG